MIEHGKVIPDFKTFQEAREFILESSWYGFLTI